MAAWQSAPIMLINAARPIVLGVSPASKFGRWKQQPKTDRNQAGNWLQNCADDQGAAEATIERRPDCGAVNDLDRAAKLGHCGAPGVGPGC